MTAVGVIGLGKLGLPYAYTFAAAGVTVYGWDDDPMARVRAESDSCGLPEGQLDVLMRQHRVEITRPDKLAEACEVVFIVVDTPSLDNGTFSSSNVDKAIASLGAARCAAVVGIVSTLSPGTMRILAAKHDWPLIYCPALIALGSVVSDLKTGPVWIIGYDHDRDAARLVSRKMGMINETGEPAFMTCTSAELAKLAVNVSVTMQVDYVNDLQRVSHRLGGDVDAIADVLHLFNRRKSITAGTPVGGPCLPRDNKAYMATGGAFGGFLDRQRYEHLTWIVTTALAGSLLPYTFNVTGRNYKDGTEYEIDSPGDAIADKLRRMGISETTRRTAELVVLAMPQRDIRLDDFLPGARVVDVWRAHSYLADHEDIVYVPLGRPSQWVKDNRD